MFRAALDLLATLVNAPAAPALEVLFGLLFLFNPAHVFEANRPFFYYGLAQTSLVLVPCFLVAFVIAAWLSTLGGARWRRLVGVVLSGAAIAAWVNSAFLTTSSGTLDGRVLVMLSDHTHVQWNTVLCAGVFLAAAGYACQGAAVTRGLLSILFTLLVLHAAWIAMTDDHPWRSGTANQRLAMFSRDKNLLVILLDSFQSDFLDDMLAREPALRRALDGFTYYRNAVGVASTTYVALPSLHAGGHYSEGQSLKQTYRIKIVEGSFMARHAQAGYDALLVNPVMNYCPRGAQCDEAGRLAYGGAQYLLDTATSLFAFSLFRVAPDAYKPAIYRWALHPVTANRVRTSNRVLDLLTRSMRADSKRPTIKFLHLFNTHPPISLDARCAEVSERPWTREYAIDQDRCAMSHLVHVLRALDGHGLYDRTAIVIVADHGAGLPRDRSSDWTSGALALPLMLLKPFDSRGGLVESPRVLGLSEVPSIVCGWTGACGGGVAPRPLATDPPVPRFSTYVWKHEYWLADSVPIDDVFEVRGPPREIASWWRISHLPVKAVNELVFAHGDLPDVYGFGWSAPEAWGSRHVRWAVGNEADLYVRVEPWREARIELDVATHALNPAQTMTVLVNGTQVADLPVTVGGDRHEILLPRDLVKDGLVRILFRFSKWNPPRPGESRKLAVAFDRLVVAGGP